MSSFPLYSKHLDLHTRHSLSLVMASPQLTLVRLIHSLLRTTYVGSHRTTPKAWYRIIVEFEFEFEFEFGDRDGDHFPLRTRATSTCASVATGVSILHVVSCHLTHRGGRVRGTSALMSLICLTCHETEMKLQST